MKAITCSWVMPPGSRAALQTGLCTPSAGTGSPGSSTSPSDICTPADHRHPLTDLKGCASSNSKLPMQTHRQGSLQRLASHASAHLLRYTRYGCHSLRSITCILTNSEMERPVLENSWAPQESYLGLLLAVADLGGRGTPGYTTIGTLVYRAGPI